MRTVIQPVSLDGIEKLLPLWRAGMEYHAQLVPFFRPAMDCETVWLTHASIALVKEDGALFAAYNYGEPVGFIHGQIQFLSPVLAPGRLGYISDLFVRADQRRRGIARLLYMTLRDWFAAKGIKDLELQAYLANAEAMAFWRAMGLAEYAMRMRLESKPTAP